MEERKQKTAGAGNWKEFGVFFKKARLSWGWIIVTLLLNAAYYAVVSFIPGSTAALYAGDFSKAAIMGVISNYLGMLALSLLTSVSMLIAEAKSTLAVRCSLWEQMMGIETRFYDQNNASTLLSAVTCDAQVTVSSLLRLIVMIPGLFMYLIMAIPQLSAYNRKLLAVLFVLIPVYVLYAVLMGRWQYRAGRSIQLRIGGLTGFLTERIRNLTLIKSFVMEKTEEENGVRASEELYRANVRYSYISGVIGGYTFVTEAVGIVAAVIWGCRLLKTGEIDLTSWMAFFLFVPMINTVLRQMSMVWSSLKDVQGRAARMGALMNAPQEGMNESQPREIPAGELALEHVSFAYKAETPILRDVSFVIPAGKTTALVGRSGSGKTTILRLLERLYTPDSGSIRVGKSELSEVNLRAWRDRLSYVTQDAELFSGTVREALTYGLEREVGDEELEQVTRLAGIYDFIQDKERGFETALAIWGSALSGGQRQRLAIARELLKNADILLLDEPTSALDVETAAAVSETFFKSFAGKTIVTVTHELNYIAKADQIVMLDQGEIADIGTHEELMERCGAYRELVEEQSYQEVFAQ